MRLFPRTPTAILLITLSGACSLRDYSYLEEGDSSIGGKTNRGGASGNAGAGGKAGAGGTSTKSGGAAGHFGSASGGGSGGTGNSTSVSGAAGGAGGPVAPFNPMGPWEFDSAAEVPASWQINLKGTVLGWVAEGQSAPLGAMTMSCSDKPMGELSHRFGPRDDAVSVDLATYTYTAYAKALNTAATVQLYSTDAAYGRAGGQPMEITASGWTKIEFPLAVPDSFTPGYNPAKLLAIGIALSGCSDTVLFDRIELVNDGAGGNSAGGGAAGAAGRSSQAGQASTSAGAAGRSLGGSSSAGTAGR